MRSAKKTPARLISVPIAGICMPISELWPATRKDKVGKGGGERGTRVTERQITRDSVTTDKRRFSLIKFRYRNEKKGHWRQLLMPDDRREDEIRNGIGSK